MLFSLFYSFLISLDHRNQNGECVRIPCPPGQEGDYQPNCKLNPQCPPEYPGLCLVYSEDKDRGRERSKLLYPIYRKMAKL